MKLSDNCLARIRNVEKLRLEAYLDTGGVWTIGYGHTGGVKEGDTCTPEQAEGWLVEHAFKVARSVDNLIDPQLSQNQFDALVSFVYNIGIGAFTASTMLRKINSRDFASAAAEFNRWIYDNGVVVDGLVSRRASERALFLSK